MTGKFRPALPFPNFHRIMNGVHVGSKEKKRNEPTWRCHHNPFVGALGIHVPVILGEPQIKDRKEMARQETAVTARILQIFRPVNN